MTGLAPARLLAPLALVVSAIALILVLSSGGSGDANPADSASPTATPTATATPRRRTRERSSSSSDTKTYTVKAGDSPSSIAAAEGVSVEDLLAANPDADPTALSVGDELEIPSG